MGLKDFFSSAGRAKSRLGRHVKTATSPYTQSADRYASMEALLKDGSEDALVGMLKRFTIVSTKSIEDEEEKGWAYRRLAELGDKVLPAAKRFCLESENIAWSLRIVEDVADETREWEILDALLEQNPPGYSRNPNKKLELLTHIADIDDPRVAPILAGYLSDTDEGVRFFATEQLVDIADERTFASLVERLCNPEEDSLRIRTRLLDGLASLEVDVSEHTDAIAKVIGQEHALRGGKVNRR